MMSSYTNQNFQKEGPRRKVLTWHIHGSYLYYLIQSPHEFYLPVRPDRSAGYGGAGGDQPWGPNVHEVPAEEVKDLDLDVILFQSRQNYEVDQYEILSAEQRVCPACTSNTTRRAKALPILAIGSMTPMCCWCTAPHSTS
jgi:hypothetical protein